MMRILTSIHGLIINHKDSGVLIDIQRNHDAKIRLRFTSVCGGHECYSTVADVGHLTSVKEFCARLFENPTCVLIGFENMFSI